MIIKIDVYFYRHVDNEQGIPLIRFVEYRSWVGIAISLRNYL
ncbi:hypothetical protein HMPREF9346_04761 [Escherichia coli MS 119-7]|nr:hypothetical protein HMPREF9346_04761 [Escherichia coli MS 119-7]